MISSDKAKVHFSGVGDFEIADILRGIYGVVGTVADKAEWTDRFVLIAGKSSVLEGKQIVELDDRTEVS